MQISGAEDTNSADIALGRFGRARAASSGNDSDPDELSAATAVQRWEQDHSYGKEKRRSRTAEHAAEAGGELSLKRPVYTGALRSAGPIH